MTPKEKAKELVDKYDETLTYLESKAKAKQCALIAVEEILKSNKLNYLFTEKQISSMEFTSDNRWIYETFIDYWQEVKHEIINL